MNVTLDEVSIQISANAQNASDNLKELSEGLTTLKNSIKGGFNNVKTLSDHLEALSSASEKLSQVRNNFLHLEVIGHYLNKFTESLASGRNLAYLTRQLEELPRVMNKFDASTLQNVTRIMNELSKAVAPLANQLSMVAEGFNAISALSDKYGVSVTRVTRYTRQYHNVNKLLRNSIQSLGSVITRVTSQNEKMFKNLKKHFDSTTSKIKQLGLSLLGTRTIFTATRKAVSEYMQMDEALSKQITNTWRAWGAQLAPAVEYVAYVFKQFVRVIYSAVLALTGIDLIARANAKAMDTWNKSIKDTLGNLQKFDDLNVAEFPKGNSDNELIDMSTIDLTPIQKVIDWVKKLRDEIKSALDTGEWYNVGKVFAEGINDGINALNFDNIKDKLRDVAKNWGEYLQGFWDEFNGNNFGKQLTEALKFLPDVANIFLNEIPWSTVGDRLREVIETFEPAEVINSIFSVIQTLLSGLGEIFTRQDAEVIASKIYDAVRATFMNMQGILDAIPWSKIGETIRAQILKINWEEVVTDIFTIIAKVFASFGKLLGGLFGKDFGDDEGMAAVWGLIGAVAIADIALLIAKLPELIGLLFKGKSVLQDITGLGVIDDLVKGATIIATLGGIALVLKELTGLLSVFNDTGLTATDAVGILATVFLGLAVAVMAMAFAFEGMNWTSIVAGIVVLGGLALVLLSITNLLDTLSKSGLKFGEVIGLLLTIFIGIAAIMALVAVLGPEMAVGMIPFAAIVLTIVALLFAMAETIPFILEAVGRFIEKIAPHIIDILDAIGRLITNIIYVLGISLPPVIDSIGRLFNTVFSGISRVVSTVGDTIVRILDAIGNLVERVFGTILYFIKELGPAVNILVDNLIAAVTKLINFVISGIEFMVNGIIKGINGLSSGLRKIGNKLFDLIGVDVKFNPISEVSLERFRPRLETGTNEVPYEGLYHLHPGEAVVPKKYNPALGGGTNEETNNRLDTLIDILRDMDTTTVVNVGNRTLYKQQQKYNKRQNDKYGTDVNL